MKVTIDCSVTIPQTLAMDIVTRFGLTVDASTNTLTISKKDYRAMEAILSDYIVSLRVAEQVNAKEAEIQARLESVVSLARLLAPQLSGASSVFAIPESSSTLLQSKSTVKESTEALLPKAPETVIAPQAGEAVMTAAKRDKLSKLKIG